MKCVHLHRGCFAGAGQELRSAAPITCDAISSRREGRSCRHLACKTRKQDVRNEEVFITKSFTDSPAESIATCIPRQRRWLD